MGELNGNFRGGIGARGSRSNLNFDNQWGFMDLPLDVALWADSARSRLACRDGQARCTFSSLDCERITDGSARYEDHGGVGFCRSLFGTPPQDPRSCTSGYATYVDDKCEVFNRDTASWQRQARSVGYSSMGWRRLNSATAAPFRLPLA